ncbi:hypothetical protein J6590_041484 [Homalodisca vitripennis]|nr:hypothetical protein J6590_041484 [Homalodisca vitripennis]
MTDITLKEALQLVKVDVDLIVGEIFIETPETVVLTDEDSADEVEGGLVDLIHFISPTTQRKRCRHENCLACIITECTKYVIGLCAK